MLSICIPTYNRLPKLKRLLNTIFNGFEGSHYEVIIADGGSTDGTLEYLRSLDTVLLIEQGKLTGSVKAFNECFKRARYKYIFYANDDFILVPEVFKKACEFLDTHPEVGAVAPKIRELSWGNMPQVHPGKYVLTSGVQIIKKDILKELNYFDEHYRTYFIDHDISYSILNLGYITVFTKEIGIIHNRFEDEIREINTRNDQNELKYFESKWGVLFDKVNIYASSHIIKKYFSLLFYFILRVLWKFPRMIQPIMKRGYKFVFIFYDWLFERSVFFKVRNNSYKEYFLAQKFPNEILY